MPRPTFVDTLENLSLKALGHSIWILGLNLAMSTQKNKIDVAEETCQQLHKKLKNTIPPRLADMVTASLLKYFHRVWRRARCNKETLRIRYKLVKAVLHPSVTELDLSDLHPGIVQAILSWLPNLPKLRVLHLGCFVEHWLGLGPMPALETVIFPSYCDDEFLLDLAKCAPNLRHLDVHNSGLVTQGSCQALWQLQHLEKLDISGCALTLGDIFHSSSRKRHWGGSVGKGALSLLRSFGVHRENDAGRLSSTLRKLTCTGRELLCHLANADLPNLEELEVKDVSDNVLPAECPGFKCITTLRLRDSRFVRQLFEVLGHHLVELELDKVVFVQLSVLLRCCRILRQLTLSNCITRPESEYDGDDWESLEYLCLNFSKLKGIDCCRVPSQIFKHASTLELKTSKTDQLRQALERFQEDEVQFPKLTKVILLSLEENSSLYDLIKVLLEQCCAVHVVITNCLSEKTICDLQQDFSGVHFVKVKLPQRNWFLFKMNMKDCQ